MVRLSIPTQGRNAREVSKKYPSERINNESDLRDWLTNVIYPLEYKSGGTEKSLAKQRIAARLNYARKTGQLAPGPLDHRNLHAFFEWAWTQRGWESLHQYADTPRSVTVHVRMETPMSAAVGSVKIRPIPTDKQALRKALIAEMEEKEQLLDARAKDQAEIASLKADLEEKYQRSERARRYGKMAKGVKKNS